MAGRKRSSISLYFDHGQVDGVRRLSRATGVPYVEMIRQWVAAGLADECSSRLGISVADLMAMSDDELDDSRRRYVGGERRAIDDDFLKRIASVRRLLTDIDSCPIQEIDGVGRFRLVGMLRVRDDAVAIMRELLGRMVEDV